MDIKCHMSVSSLACICSPPQATNFLCCVVFVSGDFCHYGNDGIKLPRKVNADLQSAVLGSYFFLWLLLKVLFLFAFTPSYCFLKCRNSFNRLWSMQHSKHSLRKHHLRIWNEHIGVRAPSDLGERGGGGDLLARKNHTMTECVIVEIGIHTHPNYNSHIKWNSKYLVNTVHNAFIAIGALNTDDK